MRQAPAPGRPPTPGPSPTRGEGRTTRLRDTDWDRWNVPVALKDRMREVARGFRKQPTPTEALLWASLRKEGLEGRKFRRQQAIGPFVVDFYCSTARLIVEVDGGVHLDQAEKDRARQECLESLGFRFVRIPAEQLERDMPAALETIRRTLIERRAVLPSPLVGEGPGVGGKTDAPEAEA